MKLFYFCGSSFQPVYFHLPIRNDQNCLVVQPIFRSGTDEEERDEIVGGWAVIPLKLWTDDNDDSNQTISEQ